MFICMYMYIYIYIYICMIHIYIYNCLATRISCGMNYNALCTILYCDIYARPLY